MSAKWRKVRLGELLNPVSREEAVDAMKEYRLLGVRLDGQGPFLRQVITGAQSAATKLFRVAQGDFIYSRLFASRGAFGIISSELSGCYVSGEFPTFVPEPEKIDAGFLRYWFQLPSTLERVAENCSGSTPLTRNRFKEEFFLALEIPLPPLPEQRRIVARIDKLAAKIDEGSALRSQLLLELDRLMICMAHRQDLSEENKRREGWRFVPLYEILRLVDDSNPVRPDQRYPNLGIYSFGRGLFGKPPIDGAITSATTLRRVKKGQFIYSRLFAFEGAYGMVRDEFDGYFVSNEYPTFDCDPCKVRAEFLAAYFKSPAVWQHVAAGSKGLGHRRQRVQPKQILQHYIWLPPLQWQERIADVSLRVKSVKRVTGPELNDLLPVILNRSF